MDDDVRSISSDVSVLSLPFSDISCYKLGSINKLFNETNYSSTYHKVLDMLKDEGNDDVTGRKSKARLFGEVEFRPKEIDEDVRREIEDKLNGLKLYRRKVKEKYEEELRRIESAQPQVDDTDRMLWGRGFVTLDYEKFMVTPPHYNHYATLTPHWADRVEVGVATREKSCEKVTQWLSSQCSN